MGVLALDYGCLHTLMEMRGIDQAERWQLFKDVRYIEAGAREVLSDERI